MIWDKLVLSSVKNTKGELETMERFWAAVLLMTLLFALSGCGGSDTSSSTIRIGYVNPTTGALAGNGEGCDWIVKQITDFVNRNPIKVDGKDKTFEIIVYDSTSDQNKCTEMAQKLIEEDHVDLMIAIQTPNTVIPVAQVAERYGVPCIATQAPVDPVAASLDEF